MGRDAAKGCMASTRAHAQPRERGGSPLNQSYGPRRRKGVYGFYARARAAAREGRVALKSVLRTKSSVRPQLSRAALGRHSYCSLSRNRERFANRIGGGVLHIFEHVTVEVGRNRRRRMSKNIADHLHRHVSAQSNARERMPQAVKGNRDAQLVRSITERRRKPIRAPSEPRRLWKDEPFGIVRG